MSGNANGAVASISAAAATADEGLPISNKAAGRTENGGSAVSRSSTCSAASLHVVHPQVAKCCCLFGVTPEAAEEEQTGHLKQDSQQQ